MDYAAVNIWSADGSVMRILGFELMPFPTRDRPFAAPTLRNSAIPLRDSVSAT